MDTLAGEGHKRKEPTAYAVVVVSAHGGQAVWTFCLFALDAKGPFHGTGQRKALPLAYPHK